MTIPLWQLSIVLISIGFAGFCIGAWCRTSSSEENLIVYIETYHEGFKSGWIEAHTQRDKQDSRKKVNKNTNKS